MHLDAEALRTKLEAGRLGVAKRLRKLADDIEALAVENAAEVVIWIGDHLAHLFREAHRVLGARGGGVETEAHTSDKRYCSRPSRAATARTLSRLANRSCASDRSFP